MLKPASSVHSIKAVAFVCEFDRDISPEGLAIVQAASKRFRSKLVGRQPIRSFAVEFQGANSVMPAAEVSGYRFFTKSPDNSDKVWFEIAGPRAIFCTSEYVSLTGFMSEALFYLGIACQAHATSGSHIIRAALEYRDEFDSEVIDWDPSQTFRKDGGYLCSAAVKKGEFWHSFCGFFGKSDHGNILNNVRVEHVQAIDQFEETPIYKLSITLTHTINLDTPKALPQDIKEEEINELLKSHLLSLRAQHKSIFKEILSDEMLKVVGFS